MIAANELAHKCAFLEQHPLRPVLVGIMQRPLSDDVETQPPGLVKSLKVDLYYALLRHSSWLKSSLFVAVITDYLAREYRLSRSASVAVVSEGVRSLSPYLSSLPASGEDLDFLRYLVVSCLESSDEDGSKAISADLGVGRGILQRIGQFMDDSDKDARVYVGEVDALIGGVVLEILEKSRSTPWIVDLYRLRYVFRDGPMEGRSFCSQTLCDQVFDLLLQMGSLSSMTAVQLADGIHELSSEMDAEKIIALMNKLGLIQLMSSDRRKNSWQLGATGFAITARAFAHRRLRVQPSIGNEELTMLPEAYQSSLLQFIPRDRLTVERFLGFCNELSPAGLRSGFYRLAVGMESEERYVLLEEMQNVINKAWLRATLCRLISDQSDIEKTRELLGKIAQGEESVGVRDAAIEGLAYLPASVPESTLRYQP